MLFLWYYFPGNIERTVENDKLEKTKLYCLQL